MKKVTKALREEAYELIRGGNSKEQCEGFGMVKVLNEIDKLTREQLEEQFVETFKPTPIEWELDKTKPIENYGENLLHDHLTNMAHIITSLTNPKTK